MKLSLLFFSLIGLSLSSLTHAAAATQTITPIVSDADALKGIQITTLTPGTGASPKASDIVVVDYEGRFDNGRVFDSSYARNRSADFRLDTVIPCWTQALQKMKVGEKAKVICPANVAYGAQGIDGVIPKNATLIFEIVLKDIKHIAAAPR